MKKQYLETASKQQLTCRASISSDDSEIENRTLTSDVLPYTKRRLRIDGASPRQPKASQTPPPTSKKPPIVIPCHTITECEFCHCYDCDQDCVTPNDSPPHRSPPPPDIADEPSCVIETKVKVSHRRKTGRMRQRTLNKNVKNRKKPKDDIREDKEGETNTCSSCHLPDITTPDIEQETVIESLEKRQALAAENSSARKETVYKLRYTKSRGTARDSLGSSTLPSPLSTIGSI